MNQPQINMSQTPEQITLPARKFLYREKHGPFMENAPKAWHEFWDLAGIKLDKNLITSMSGLGYIDETKQGDEKYLYQAGVMIAEQPPSVPSGLHIRDFAGGKYVRFLLTGSYKQLPHAFPMARNLTEKAGHIIRNDFSMDRYLNTPMDTPEEKLKTEILIPVD